MPFKDHFTLELNNSNIMNDKRKSKINEQNWKS